MAVSGRRPTVLVVDDVRENAELVADFLDEVDCEVAKAEAGDAALTFMRLHAADLVLLDVEMPGLSGLEVCRQIKEDPATTMVPVVIVTAYSALEDRVAALEAGADDFLSKPVEQTELVARVRSLLRIKALHDSLLQASEVVFALARAVEAKDGFTRAHSDRVARYAECLASAAGLDPESVRTTVFAARVHDIGKIGVPDALLQKKDSLSAQEVAVMRQVPVTGAEICAPLRTPRGLSDVLRHQKERFDGSGFPDGLAGDAIPEPARVLAICDAYDSMVGGDRAERPRMAEDRARAVLARQAGSAFDRRLVGLFLGSVLQASAASESRAT